MKYTALEFFFAVAVLFHAELWANAPQKHLMTDPLMGLSYDPDSVHFDFCPRGFDFREGSITGKQWIFAKCKQDESTYYIYSGLFKHWSDRDEKWVDSIMEPDFGSVVKITGKKFEEIGTPDVLYGKKAKLSEKAGKCLVEDAVNRYSIAFGNISGLQKAVTKKGIAAENLPKILVDALRSGGVTIPDKMTGYPPEKSP
ncbi:MAG TPA: hypothetical protein VJ385_01200 [Fibrobacteria bacterium]|nr:hypothetical protein [Fibrobacteria bacterium]